MPRITASSPLSPPRKDTMTKVVASRPRGHYPLRDFPAYEPAGCLGEAPLHGE